MKNEEKIARVNEIRRLEQAKMDLEEAWAYTEVLIEGEYHAAAAHVYSENPIPMKDRHIFNSLVMSLNISFSRAHKYVGKCLESEADRWLVDMVKYNRDKYFAHSDKKELPDMLGRGSYVKHLPAWKKEHTICVRELIEKTLKYVEEMKEKAYDKFEKDTNDPTTT